MDIKNFRKLVQESAIKDKLNSLEVTVNYPILNAKREFKGIQSIYKFILDQVIGWNEIEHLPNYLISSKNHFERLKSHIIQLADYFQESSQSQFNTNLSVFQNDFINQKNQNNNFIFLYDCPETDLIIKTYIHNSKQTQGLIDFITESNISLSSDKNYFIGVMLGYEFKNQNDSHIIQRRNNEKASLSKIRDKYNDYLVEAEQQLNANINDAKDNLTHHFETVDVLKTEKNNSFDTWFNDVKLSFTAFFKESSESILNNESLYREKLRLEAPADYWKQRAILLKNESKIYMKWLIGISVLTAFFLFILLMTLGNGFFETAFGDTVKGIKWSIILITLVSFLAFAIKILAKMTFSSLHLSRDAEEREQLTHFYLALKKDTTIEPEERQLILQSLFSRADTGLLKEDSSPTMPSSIVEKFTGK